MMHYFIKDILNNKKIRSALAKHPFTFEDEYGVFPLDFRKDSIRINHRRTFNILYRLGGDGLMEKILKADNTCLTTVKGNGTSPIEGTDRYFLKTNAIASTALSSILCGIVAWGEMAEEEGIDFDPSIIRCTLTDEEYETIFYPLEPVSDPLHDGPGSEAPEAEPAAEEIPMGIDGSIILKDDLYAIYDNEANTIVSLPFTDGTAGSLHTMAVCEPVDPQRPELGRKYKLQADDKKWGWLHPEFVQVFGPCFDKFDCLKEDNDVDLLAWEQGEGLHSVHTLWSYCAGLMSRMEQLPMHTTKREFNEGGFMLFAADHPVYRFKKKIDENGTLCILISSGYTPDFPLWCEEYWEISDEGASARYDVWTGEKFFSHAGRSYGFGGHTEIDFMHDMIRRDADYCSKGICYLEKKGDTHFSLHAVSRKNEPHAFALGLEVLKGTESRLQVLTPFVFTELSNSKIVLQEEGATVRICGKVLGRNGVLHVACNYEKQSAAVTYPVPFEYESVLITDTGITLRKEGLVGEMNLDGKWTKPLHDPRAAAEETKQVSCPAVPNARNFKEYFSEYGGKGRHSQVRMGTLDVEVRFEDQYADDIDPEHFLYGDFDIEYNNAHGGKAVEGLQRLKAYALTDDGIIYASGNAIWYRTEGGTVLLGLQEKVLSLEVYRNTLTVAYCGGYVQEASNEHRDLSGYMYEGWYDVYKVDVKKRQISF